MPLDIRRRLNLPGPDEGIDLIARTRDGEFWAEFVGEVYELGLPTHYKPNEITALLRAPSSGLKIVFTTYQSSDKLAAAAPNDAGFLGSSSR